jgi:hypothetical protein
MILYGGQISDFLLNYGLVPFCFVLEKNDIMLLFFDVYLVSIPFAPADDRTVWLKEGWTLTCH